MDALSDILKAVRLEGAVYLDAEFTAPWCTLASHGLDAIRKRLPRAEHVICFHFVAAGRFKVRLGDGTEAQVAAGDLILFTHEEPQLMGSDLRLKPAEGGALMASNAVPGSDVVRMTHGGGGEATRLVCGYLACDRSVYRLLLESLPRVLHVPAAEGPAGYLVRELLRMGVRESEEAKPGAHSMLAKLSELMFVEALRRYVDNMPAERRGWLAGVRDPHIGRALALVHGDPEREWNVESLAREVAMSRSAFADRFGMLVGEPPIQYLLRWRLALAAQALRAGDEAIARIAARSGYESDAAFSRAFKREFGVPPAAWRKAAVR